MKLVPEDSDILRRVAQPFDFEHTALDPEELANEMIETMLANRGIGLAAPQIGLGLRVFVMGGDDLAPMACFNPEVVAVSPTTVRAEEGCLSFPDLWLKVQRPEWAELRFFDQSGHPDQRIFKEVWARCALHETEHLQGKVFTDMVGPLALKMARKRRKKMKER